VIQVAFVVKFHRDRDEKPSKDEFESVHFPVNDRNGDGLMEAVEAPEDRIACQSMNVSLL
jgi:hypothetical protein